jgi:SAM-dependent methyltransferase
VGSHQQNYLLDPELYHKVQSSVPFEMEMYDVLLNSLDRFSTWYSPRILDLCCGTGLLTSRLETLEFWREVVGLDIDGSYIQEARKHCTDKVKFVLGDATAYRATEPFDVIVGASAYHHIRDQFKHQFAECIARNLKEDGFVFIIENFFPEYQDERSYRESQYEYYRYLISYLEHENVDGKVINSIKAARLIDYIPDDFKVDMKTFIHHFETAGLKISETIKVWPKEEAFADKNAGGFVIEITRK